MSDASPRFGLPFILPGQAQKELFHNEALALIDAALHPAVEGPPDPTPPPAPAEGQCWIVDAGAAGPWTGCDFMIAAWSAGGWRFLAPTPGMTAWNKADAVMLRWDGVSWTGELTGSALVIAGQQVVGPRCPPILSPSGGTIIDTEARAAIDALIATLMSHGLTE